MRVRALIPVRMQQFHQLETQRESLEKGLEEIATWLDDTEQFLKDHVDADKSMEGVQSSLDRHQAHFSRLVNYKLLLDDKWKIFQLMVPNSSTQTAVNDSNSQFSFNHKENFNDYSINHQLNVCNLIQFT